MERKLKTGENANGYIIDIPEKNIALLHPLSNFANARHKNVPYQSISRWIIGGKINLNAKSHQNSLLRATLSYRLTTERFRTFISQNRDWAEHIFGRAETRQMAHQRVTDSHLPGTDLRFRRTRRLTSWLTASWLAPCVWQCRKRARAYSPSVRRPSAPTAGLGGLVYRRHSRCRRRLHTAQNIIPARLETRPRLGYRLGLDRCG